MQKIILLSAISFLFFSCGQNATNKNEKEKNPSEKISVYTTSQNTPLKISLTDSGKFQPMPQPRENQICVFVDASKQYQTYVGTGGAITDATAETFYKLSPEKQQQIIEAYFDKTKGIGYNIVRTNINSCDFSSDMYTYIAEGDKELKTFDIAHDKKFKIPMIKLAKQKAGNINLFASPWSPPAFMKDNNDMLHGGKLKPEYYDAWANYFIKFIEAYKKENISLWGISVQNEPMATQRWESCIYEAKDEINFLKNNLGPALEKNGMQQVKVIVWDHNRDLIYQRTQQYMNDMDAAKYIWGVGFHWYEGWSGGTMMHENIKRVNEAYPNLNLFFTEGCAEKFDSSQYNNWALGEKYAASMIEDFNNGMCGFTDWNILLDEHGGPNHVDNFCFAPVHANTKTNEIIFTNAYYCIGHFSKFIQPGAKRIICAPSRSMLDATAFLNPDGKRIVVVLNTSDKEALYFIYENGYSAEFKINAHSIQTIIY